MDNIPVPTALSKVVTHGSLRIGFTHGHTIIPPGDPDSLLIAARQMDVDVLCWGGTCKFEAYEMEGKFFVNPGSATGAVSWSADVELDSEGEEKATPSFVLMDVSSNFDSVGRCSGLRSWERETAILRYCDTSKGTTLTIVTTGARGCVGALRVPTSEGHKR